MIYLKTPYEIKQIEYANELGAELLQQCYEKIKPGLVTIELEEMAERFCVDNSVRPSFKGYRGFPFCLCISLNEEIIHGFPSECTVGNGDIVSIDFGIEKDGYYSDAAFTKIVGDVPEKIEKLVKTTEECLYEGIKKAVPGNRIYDISSAIYYYAKRMGFNVVRNFVGHGVGLEVHEDPKIPNYVANGVNWKLRPGMVIAIEPMLVENDYELYTAKNRWTAITKDHGMSAHFERSIAILKGGPKILGNF